MYRPGFSGHKILLCGRPDWGECGEPFAPGLSRAAGGILLQQPVLVIARDEGPDRAANFLGFICRLTGTPRRLTKRAARQGVRSPSRAKPPPTVWSAWQWLIMLLSHVEHSPRLS